MEAEDRKILKEIVRELDRLVDNKEVYGEKNIPGEFGGFTADLLYDVKVKNQTLVQVIEGYILSLSTKKNKDIVAHIKDFALALRNTIDSTEDHEQKSSSSTMSY